MDIESQLRTFGLNKSDVKVYLALLENGISSPNDIARATKISRPNCYQHLKSLETARLAHHQLQGKRKVYLAKDPAAIQINLTEKQSVADRLIPQLRDLYTPEKNKPQLEWFTGWNEVKEIYRQTLVAEKIISIGAMDEQFMKIDPAFSQWYIRELEERKIIVDEIFGSHASTAARQAIAKIRGGLHSIKELGGTPESVPTDLLIWDDHIALIGLEKPVFGSIITNAGLTRTFKTIFGILWIKL
jgi:sugar-specific transcriptional regulator TrmB